VSHSDDLNPLLAVYEPRIDFFHTVRVFEGSDGIRKIYAMLAKVHGGFTIVPLVSHVKIVPDIGTNGKWATSLPRAGAGRSSNATEYEFGATARPSRRLAARRSTW
jgi:hypothetical protein